MMIEPVHILPSLPERPQCANKGTFGKVLIIAGSRGMTGAAVLAGQGALRGGAGLVFVATPRCAVDIVACSEPSYMTIGLPDCEKGCVAGSSEKIISTKLNEVDVAVLGPGLGRCEQLDRLVPRLYQQTACPMVIDADALNAIAEQQTEHDNEESHLFAQHAGVRILTPHPGEFSRMTGLTIDEIQSDPESHAIAFARTNHVIVLLKGSRSIITDGTRIAHNTTGNSGLATGGSGDVLSGLIASLIAQQMQPFQATQLAAHLHGLAAEFATINTSTRSLIASDLPSFIGLAYHSLE